MMNKTFLCVAATAALLAPAFAVEAWTTNLPAAFEQAAKEGKAVVVDFNGSDWCGPCRMLKSKVLDTPEFIAYAKDKFVLVDMDVPHGDKLPLVQKALNSNLAKMFGIRGYPTVLVLNKDGALLGGFRGATDQLAVAKSYLDAAVANSAAVESAMTKAAAVKGEAKVRALMAAFAACPEEVADYNVILRDEIIANDPADLSGLAAKEKAKADELDARKRSYELTLGLKGQARLDKLSKELERTDLSDIYRFVLARHKVEQQFMLCETLADIAAAKAQYLAYGEAYPEEKEAMEARVAEINETGDDIMLERLKNIRDLEARRK